MPKLKRTTPCAECPFRRTAAIGWLGDDTPRGFLRATVAEQPMPCHPTIDYSDPHWQENQYPDAALCAGSLAFLANWMKLPRDRELADGVRAVGKRADCFATTVEFLEYHKGGFQMGRPDPKEQIDDILGIGIH